MPIQSRRVYWDCHLPGQEPPIPTASSGRSGSHYELPFSCYCVAFLSIDELIRRGHDVDTVLDERC